MKAYAEVIGDPIAHSKSPLIHNFWLETLGSAAAFAPYRRWHVPAGELAGYLAERREDARFLGCNVTIPHKEAMAAAVDVAEGDFGAINTVVRRDGRLIGYNTDVDGIVGPVMAALGNGAGAVAVIGAGGAARAALWALKHRLPHEVVRVLVRRPEQGAALLADIGLAGSVAPIAAASLDGVSLLINASPLGMTGKPPLDLDLAGMRDDGAVFDMVYAPLETALLRDARARGLVSIDGLDMLIGQARRAFALFYGLTAPDDDDANRALRALLTA